MTSSHIFSGVSSIPLPAATAGGSSPLTLRDMLFFLRMRWLWIVATTSAFLAMAGAYVLTAEPTFVASTQLLVFPQVNGSEAQTGFRGRRIPRGTAGNCQIQRCRRRNGEGA